MLFGLYSITLVISAFLFSWIGCHVARYLLSSAQLMDEPNERSNHDTPVPRGGGIAVMTSIVGFLCVAGTPSTLLLAATGIAIISFMDDRGGISIKWRLLIQTLAVLLLFLPNGMIATVFDGPVFQGLLSPLADKLLAGFLLIGFMNLFNFMDGIDGITGVETISIGLGLFILSFFVVGIRILGVEGLILASAIAGFLWLNWHPAKLFLGDVGSVALGFLLGFFLLQLAAEGYWAAALILPAYYLVDGGLTFLKRLFTGEKVWEAHSQHAYQKAVRSGYGHDWVVIRIGSLNVALVVLAVFACVEPAYALQFTAAAYGISLVGWFILLNAKKPATQTIITPQGNALST
ncbi:MAG: glycosyltransferase family 4 protein [Rickettsiales bacterium]|nr:glycosyltransferase family 4 protein [Rickettsiales bacterium]